MFDSKQRNTTETCYAVRCFQAEEDVLVLAGSSTPIRFINTSMRHTIVFTVVQLLLCLLYFPCFFRGCLRILKVRDGSLEPHAILYDKEGANNSQVVRCAVYNPVDGTVISGGEDGIINVWKRGEERNQTSAINPLVDVPSRKSANSRKNSKNKPY